MQENLYFLNYSNSADVITIALGYIVTVYINSTYVSKQNQMRLLMLANTSVIFSAFMSLLFHTYVEIPTAPEFLLYFLHHMSYIPLIYAYAVFVRYLVIMLRPGKLEKNIIHYLVLTVLFVFIIVESLTHWIHIGFYIEEGRVFVDTYYTDPFRWAYIAMTIICMLLIFSHKRRFVTKMFWCLIAVVGVLYIVVIVEDLHKTTQYISFTFIVPIITVLFMYHYNAYDSKTGTLDYNTFKGYINEISKNTFSMICLELPGFDDTRISEMEEDFYHFNEKFFKNPITFRVSEKFILVAKTGKDEITQQKKKRIVSDFEKLYQKYQKEYRILFVDSYENLISADEYLRFMDACLRTVPINSVHQVVNDEIEKYLYQCSILDELKDIKQKRNLDDGRVEVYCQPVLDIESGKYTSAEALMRLKPVDKPMFFPDQFIPLAENNGCIHILSEIILNKVCAFTRKLMDEGYEFERISINFSSIELRDSNFCSDIISIISRHNIPFDKIAIELTESRNDEDFELVSRVITVLRGKGIRFYLDDFGTGYSNVERILKLPMDVIKFDRSLTISSGLEENSRMVVGSFSEIFKKTNYQILFEGVETDEDEARCIDMNANYLQGYKYSKPIPIEMLRDYFEK